jgi:hypothetical protein
VGALSFIGLQSSRDAQAAYTYTIFGADSDLVGLFNTKLAAVKLYFHFVSQFYTEPWNDRFVFVFPHQICGV